MAKKKKKSKKRPNGRSGSIDEAPSADHSATANTETINHVDGNNGKDRKSSALSTANKKEAEEEEDLSLQRHDEETVLSAIYGDDFTAEMGTWNSPLYVIRVRPASELTGGEAAPRIPPAAAALPPPHNPNDEDDGGGRREVTLRIQLNTRYPRSVPLIQITDASREVSTRHIARLMALLQSKARECAAAGQVMGWEMAQVAEHYLVDCAEGRGGAGEKARGAGEDHAAAGPDGGDDYAAPRASSGGAADGLPMTRAASPSLDHAWLVDSDTQKEVERQRRALDAAARRRQQRRMERRRGALPAIADADADDEKHDEDEDEEEEEKFLRQLPPGCGEQLAATSPGEGALADDGAPAGAARSPPGAAAAAGSNVSRYQTDFVEMGILGRGGGGEVVQAINRLDRRGQCVGRTRSRVRAWHFVRCSR